MRKMLCVAVCLAMSGCGPESPERKAAREARAAEREVNRKATAEAESKKKADAAQEQKAKSAKGKADKVEAEKKSREDMVARARKADAILIDEWNFNWKNKIRAEQMWKDEEVKVIGIVGKVSAGLTGTPYVMLRGKGILGVIRADFRRGEREALVDLVPDSAITVYGKCSSQGMLKDCILIK